MMPRTTPCSVASGDPSSSSSSSSSLSLSSSSGDPDGRRRAFEFSLAFLSALDLELSLASLTLLSDVDPADLCSLNLAQLTAEDMGADADLVEVRFAGITTSILKGKVVRINSDVDLQPELVKVRRLACVSIKGQDDDCAAPAESGGPTDGVSSGSGGPTDGVSSVPAADGGGTKRAHIEDGPPGLPLTRVVAPDAVIDLIDDSDEVAAPKKSKPAATPTQWLGGDSPRDDGLDAWSDVDMKKDDESRPRQQALLLYYTGAVFRHRFCTQTKPRRGPNGLQRAPKLRPKICHLRWHRFGAQNGSTRDPD